MKPPCPPCSDKADALGSKALVGTNLAGAWGRAFVFPVGSGAFAPVCILGVFPPLQGAWGHPSCRGEQGGVSLVPIQWVEKSSLCPSMALLLVFVVI